MPFEDTYGKYSVAHGDDEYYADVGRGSVWVTKVTNDAWVLVVTIDDPTQDLNGDYIAQVLKKEPLGAGDLAHGQPELKFTPERIFGFKAPTFTIEIKELVDPKKPAGAFHTYKLAFEMFESEKDNPIYDKASTTKKGDPVERDPGRFAGGVARKLAGEFNATDPSSDTNTTTNTPLLLGVGLLVVAVGFYGMRR